MLAGGTGRHSDQGGKHAARDYPKTKQNRVSRGEFVSSFLPLGASCGLARKVPQLDQDRCAPTLKIEQRTE
jgi:hypothetical protein